MGRMFLKSTRRVLGHSLLCSLVRSHHSLIRLLRTARALRCALSFAHLPTYSQAAHSQVGIEGVIFDFTFYSRFFPACDARSYLSVRLNIVRPRSTILIGSWFLGDSVHDGGRRMGDRLCPGGRSEERARASGVTQTTTARIIRTTEVSITKH